MTGKLEMRLENLRLEDGELRADLFVTSDVAPTVDVLVGGETVGTARLRQDPAGHYAVTAALPSAALRAGMTLIVLQARSLPEPLGVLPVLVGWSEETDALTRIARLEIELATLKRAVLEDGRDPKLRQADKALIIAQAVEAALADIAAPKPVAPTARPPRPTRSRRRPTGAPRRRR